jgi:hypothetical protein
MGCRDVMTRWEMTLGPASVVLTTALPVEETAAAMRARADPVLFALAPAADAPGLAQVVHVTTPSGLAGVSWDGSTLTVCAADEELSAAGLLHLAYLRLEAELHRQGLLTLHAAAACRDGAAVLLLGSAGAGKTTTLLRLCRDHGAAMVGNDLVVVGGLGAVPYALTGTHHLRLRHASVARAMPELLGLFTGEVADSWRAKRDVDPARLGIEPADEPVPVTTAVFIRVDRRYAAVVDEAGDTLVHRLNLYENALRYVRGTSTPWLQAAGRFGPYVPPLDDEQAHRARTATLERLLGRSRYVAGPPAAVAEHLSMLLADAGPQVAEMRRTC